MTSLLSDAAFPLPQMLGLDSPAGCAVCIFVPAAFIIAGIWFSKRIRPKPPQK